MKKCELFPASACSVIGLSRFGCKRGQTDNNDDVDLRLARNKIRSLRTVVEGCFVYRVLTDAVSVRR
jgi:hypothetical protein